MAKEDNLTSLGERPEEERREIARKGGIASGEAKRRKRTLRAITEALADKMISVKNPQGQVEELTFDVAMMQRQYQKAIIDGDTNAARFIANILGEEVVQQVNTTIYNVKSETATKMQQLADTDI